MIGSAIALDLPPIRLRHTGTRGERKLARVFRDNEKTLGRLKAAGIVHWKDLSALANFFSCKGRVIDLSKAFSGEPFIRIIILPSKRIVVYSARRTAPDKTEMREELRVVKPGNEQNPLDETATELVHGWTFLNNL